MHDLFYVVKQKIKKCYLYYLYNYLSITKYACKHQDCTDFLKISQSLDMMSIERKVHNVYYGKTHVVYYHKGPRKVL